MRFQDVLQKKVNFPIFYFRPSNFKLCDWHCCVSRQVDMTKINLETLKPWVTKKITTILGMEDDVVIEFVFNQLEEKVRSDIPDVSNDVIFFQTSRYLLHVFLNSLQFTTECFLDDYVDILFFWVFRERFFTDDFDFPYNQRILTIGSELLKILAIDECHYHLSGGAKVACRRTDGTKRKDISQHGT